MIEMLTRLRGRSLTELAVRGRQALRARVERFAFDAVEPGRRRPRSCGAPRVFPLAADIDAIVRAVAAADPDVAARWRARSEQTAGGSVALLGHGPLPVGNPPRWHTEALSGRTAPRAHWSVIDYLDVTQVGDHKLLWELNRHQYLLAPAFAWRLDREPARFDLVQSHLDSWLAENPPRRGVHWASSLEVAYRAIAWCWLLWVLEAAPWDPLVRARLLESLAAHALHVERYLSTYFSPNTHLTGEALGLFYVGTALAESPHAARWRAKGARILETSLARQVHADGVYFEQASQYQRYTTEIYLHYCLLGRATGWPVSEAVGAALERLFVVLRTMSSARGCIPLLGDDDGGLLLPLEDRAPDDVRGLLLAGAVALRRPDLLVAGAVHPTISYWLCGIEATDRCTRAARVVPGWRDRHFARGGIAVLRDGWDDADAVAVLDAGPHGALGGGHAHADALAMTLALGRTELFIDRGTLTYTGPERDEFRCTGSHNTLEVGGESSVQPGGPFRWRNVPPAAAGVVLANALFSGFEGTATGHVGEFGPPSTHSRSVLHRRGGAWLILDRGSRATPRGSVLRWQLAPQVRAERTGPGSVQVRDRSGGAVATILLFGATGVRLAARTVSLRLGHEAPAQVLELEVDAAVVTVVVPGGLAVPLADAGPFAGAWEDAEGRHRVTVGAAGASRVEGRIEARGIRVDADLCWWLDRSAAAPPAGRHPDLFAAIGVRSLDGSASAQRMVVCEYGEAHWVRVALGNPDGHRD